MLSKRWIGESSSSSRSNRFQIQIANHVNERDCNRLRRPIQRDRVRLGHGFVSQKFREYFHSDLADFVIIVSLGVHINMA